MVDIDAIDVPRNSHTHENSRARQPQREGAAPHASLRASPGSSDSRMSRHASVSRAMPNSWSISTSLADDRQSPVWSSPSTIQMVERAIGDRVVADTDGAVDRRCAGSLAGHALELQTGIRDDESARYGRRAAIGTRVRLAVDERFFARRRTDVAQRRQFDGSARLPSSRPRERRRAL